MMEEQKYRRKKLSIRYEKMYVVGGLNEEELNNLAWYDGLELISVVQESENQYIYFFKQHDPIEFFLMS